MPCGWLLTETGLLTLLVACLLGGFVLGALTLWLWREEPNDHGTLLPRQPLGHHRQEPDDRHRPTRKGPPR